MIKNKNLPSTKEQQQKVIDADLKKIHNAINKAFGKPINREYIKPKRAIGKAKIH